MAITLQWITFVSNRSLKQDKEGLEFLYDWWQNYDSNTTLYNHISWHVGLWSLETGDLDQIWQILDEDIAPEISHGPPLNVLTDTAALLLRAELMGVDIPIDRWRKMSDYALARFPKPGLAFADVHAAIAHARCSNRGALDALIDSTSGPAGDITRTIASGYREMEDKNWAAAADYFEDSIHDHARIGVKRSARYN